ncbi:uncharacterized protein LOC105208048 isoform X2 [Solenopsis invicta]|nr:uncharacterized protein LOC105208048 isoform X2 [Solenopsis invicta]
MDYNGPVVMEDFDDTSDHNLVSHIRVKRNEPIIHQQLIHSMTLDRSMVDSLPQDSGHSVNVKDIFADSMFDNRSDINLHSRRKRGVLSKNGHHRRRVKGNAKHHAKTNNKNKKHGVLKSSHRPIIKKINNPTSKKRSNARKIAKAIDESRTESRIEKRESENSSLNINTANDEETGALINQKENVSLTNNRSLAEQRKENAVMLPFVHTGRAELRVRIEKIPTNESSFINPTHWTDRSVGTSPCSIMLPKYNTSDKILDVTNLELTPNFDSVERKKANNLTVKITLKKLHRGNNASGQESSNSESTLFSNAESYPVGSNVSEIEDNRNTENEKYDRTNEISTGSLDKDAKSRAKRNQEITSKRYERNAKGSKCFKDTEQGTSIKDTKHEKIRYRRTVRSIEEIKDLAEKLIVKISELQVYVSNRNETSHARDCLGKNADSIVVEEKPNSSLKKKDVSSSKVTENANNHKRFAKKTVLTSKRASQMRPSGSRFARGEYRIGRTPRRKWGRWLDWSSCSVTCGKGRQIRWRHCLHDCNDAETEMEEKACQLPACPSKFLGIF